MDTQYKTGILRGWNAAKGYGFIEVPTSTFPLLKYFLHINEIKDGPNPPPVGSIVRLEPAPPRKPGQLPMAKNVVIIVLPEKVSALAVA